jgi:hypothetical protein
VKIQKNKNEYAKNALILHPLETVMIVIKYAEVNFLPVGCVIKPTFATIVLRHNIGIIGSNYAVNVMKHIIKMRKNEIVLGEKRMKRMRQDTEGITHTFSQPFEKRSKRSRMNQNNQR